MSVTLPSEDTEHLYDGEDNMDPDRASSLSASEGAVPTLGQSVAT